MIGDGKTRNPARSLRGGKRSGGAAARTRNRSAHGKMAVEASSQPNNIVCLQTMSQARRQHARAGTGLPRGHSAQIMFFTGVQIVRHEQAQDHAHNHVGSWENQC